MNDSGAPYRYSAQLRVGEHRRGKIETCNHFLNHRTDCLLRITYSSQGNQTWDMGTNGPHTCIIGLQFSRF